MSQVSQGQGVEVEVIEPVEDEVKVVADPELEEITIGEPEAPTGNEEGKDSTVLARVREAHRESEKKRKEAERKLAEVEAKIAPVETSAPVVSAKPKLEDHDYDSEAYEAALEKWHEQKSARAAYEAKQRNVQEDTQKQQQKIVDDYRAKADALPVDKAKFKVAEQEVMASFNPMQQLILLKSAIPERLVMALGNNPERLDAISKLTDPIDLAFELGRTEKQLTSTKQTKSAPQPDRPLTGGGSGPADTALDRLEAEAEKTGDRSKVVAYKRQKRLASK